MTAAAAAGGVTRGSEEEAKAHAKALSTRLQADRTLRRLIEEAGGVRGWYDRESDSERLRIFCDRAAEFLIEWARSVPHRIASERNAAFVEAVNRFAHALGRFEQESGRALPSTNEIMERWLDDYPGFMGERNIESYWCPLRRAERVRVKGRQEQQERWRRHDSWRDNPWDLRTIPSVTLYDLLDWLRLHAEPGEYKRFGTSAFRHPWLQTPKGQDPRKPASAAAWWVVRVLRHCQFDRTDARTKLASYLVPRLEEAWCNMTGEAAGGTREHGKVIEGMFAEIE